MLNFRDLMMIFMFGLGLGLLVLPCYTAFDTKYGHRETTIGSADKASTVVCSIRNVI